MTDNHLVLSLCRDGGVLSIAQMSAADAAAIAAVTERVRLATGILIVGYVFNGTL